jgi:hypothetical protein
METEVRLVHLYDIERHRIACGAAGQSNSTKHPRGVTCKACLELVAGTRAVPQVERDDGVSFVH